MDKSRIAIVVPALIGGDGGGVSTVASFLYRTIAESGRYEPDLISLATSATDESSVRLLSPLSCTKGTQITEGIWNEKPFLHVGAFLAELEFQRYRPRQALTDLLNKYDLIQFVAGFPAWALIGRNVERPVLLQVATLVSVERSAALARSKGLKGLWLRWMTRATSKLDIMSLQYVKSVFVENEWMYAHLQEYVDPSKVVFAPPGVDTDLFRPALNQDLSQNNDYLLFVGRASDPRKNIRMLFEAYYHLRQALPHTPRLMMITQHRTTPSDWNVAVSLDISRHIETRHDVDINELAELYRYATLFVLSSDEEGLGIVILEAMASGIPVVSTRCGGPEAVVEHGKTGYLTPVGDAQALATRMQELLVDTSLRRRMGEAGRKVALQRFSLPVTGKVFLDKYDELMAT